jgi:hypothetical protein
MMYLIVVLGLVGVGAAAWAMWTPDATRTARLPEVVDAAPASAEAPATLAEARATLATLPPVERPKPVRSPAKRRRGRTLSPIMQAALAVPDSEEHIVMDVAAVRDSAPGQALLNCLPFRDSQELDRLKKDAGFDPINQVERFGFAGDVAVIEGDFGDVDWLKMNEEFTLDRQEDGIDIYTNGFRHFAVAEGRHLIAGRPDQLEAALVRIRDGVTEGAPSLNGAVSGRVPLPALFNMLPVNGDVRSSMTELLAEQGGALNLNIDVTDRGAKVNFGLDDVDPMLKEAIKAGVEAVKGGGVPEHQREKLGPLIEAIEVRDGANGINIHTPVTMEFLEHALGDCVHRDRPID